MQLSGELFKQIVGQLKSATGASDRRDKPRVGLRSRVTLIVLGGNEDKTARSMDVGVKDLSLDGIGLVHHSPLAPDTIFAVRLPLHGSRDMTVVYKVKNCRPLEKDLFGIGAMLIKMDDPGPAPPAAAKPAALTPAKADPAAAPVAAEAVAAK